MRLFAPQTFSQSTARCVCYFLKFLFNSVKMLAFAAILIFIYVNYVVIVMLNTLGEPGDRYELRSRSSDY